MRWPFSPLGECTKIVGGATPSTSVTTYWDGDIWWATPKDLSELDGMYIDQTPRTITKSGLASCAADLLPVGSVLFSSRAPIGHVAINRVPLATNQGFKSFIPDKSRLNSHYLFWWLRANRSHLEGLGNGATFKELSKAAVARIEIPLPPLAVQMRIAAILDQADELRRKRHRAIKLLDALPQAVFQQMFGKPVPLPKGWREVKLEDIVRADDQINYGVVQPGSDREKGVPLVRVANVVNNDFTGTSLKKIDPIIEARYKRSRLHGDEILVACVGSIGAVALAEPELAGSNIARAVARIRVDDRKADRRYIAEFLRLPRTQHYFQLETRTVAQPTLNIKQLCETPLFLPPYDLQSKFVRKIAAVGKIRYAQLRHLTALDTLFASLQDRAFSGALTSAAVRSELEAAG